ncbi:hypothetical protein [Streptomyces sp. NPDC004726]
MAPMRRGLVHAMAWALSTGAAVTLSWWGVHTVMSGTAYDRPRALPINADSPTMQGAKPQVSATARPPSAPPKSRPTKSSDSVGASGGSGGRTDRPTSTQGVGAKPGKTAKPTPPSATPPAAKPSGNGNVKGYTVDGGRVVFDMGPTSAELASATPNAGWRMQVWTDTYWIRVAFMKDGREVSVFCTWNGHPPKADFYEGDAP